MIDFLFSLTLGKGTASAGGMALGWAGFTNVLSAMPLVLEPLEVGPVEKILWERRWRGVSRVSFF